MKTQHITATASTSASVDTVWALAGDVTTWTSWAPFESAVLERTSDDGAEGVGAVRAFVKGWFRTREEIIEYAPGLALSYRLLSGLPLPSYRARLALESTTSGTTIRWSADFRPSIPGTGGAFRRGMQRLYDHFAQRLATSAASAEAVTR